MRYGTSHFVNRAKAVKYYGQYEADPERAVSLKLEEGSIHLGPPKLHAGQRLLIIDDGTRYAIEDYAAIEDSA